MNIEKEMEKARKQIVKEQKKEIKKEIKYEKETEKDKKKDEKYDKKFYSPDELKEKRSKEHKKYREKYDEIIHRYNVYDAINPHRVSGGNHLENYGITFGMPLDEMKEICCAIHLYASHNKNVNKSIIQLYQSPDLTQSQKGLIKEAIMACLNQGEYGHATVQEIIKPQYTPEEIRKMIKVVRSEHGYTPRQHNEPSIHDKISAIHAITELETMDKAFDSAQLAQIRRAEKLGLGKSQLMVYANPEFDASQMEIIADAFESKIDIDKIKLFANPELDTFQMHTLRSACLKSISAEDLAIAANPEFNVEQMNTIISALEVGIRSSDVKLFADPKISAERMQAVSLALKSGVSHQTISKMLNPKNSISKINSMAKEEIETVNRKQKEKILKTLNTTIDNLRDDPKKQSQVEYLISQRDEIRENLYGKKRDSVLDGKDGKGLHDFQRELSAKNLDNMHTKILSKGLGLE